MSGSLLQVLALGCERDWRQLFEQLSFSLDPGMMLQVAGPNGSGKTSLLRLLAGLMEPSAGEILFRGRRLARAELASEVLWIGHTTGVKGLLTAEENLAWLCALHQPVSRGQIATALEAVGLRGFEDVPCHTLSAGQQRRVALARLYLPGPALWILDEPFTALDRRGVEALERHLAAHCAEGGMVILTTHHVLENRAARFEYLELGQAAA